MSVAKNMKVLHKTGWQNPLSESMFKMNDTLKFNLVGLASQISKTILFASASGIYKDNKNMQQFGKHKVEQ